MILMLLKQTVIFIYCTTYSLIIDMEFKNGFPNQIQEQEHSKDLKMEDLSAVDPKVNSQETFTRRSFFHNTFSRNTFKLSTIKDVGVRMQERAKNVKASRVITLIVMLVIFGIFLIPVILYYALKTDPIPELNSAFTDVNISMVSISLDIVLTVMSHCMCIS